MLESLPELINSACIVAELRMVFQVKNTTEVIGGKFRINAEGEQVSKLSKCEELVQKRISKCVITVIMSCVADING